MRSILIPLLFTVTFVDAKTEKKPRVKQTIRCNMTVRYKVLPPKVDTFSEFLNKGILYGRFRTNTFLFDAGSVGENHFSSAVGGNLTYKSARLNGFSFTTGLYTSQNPLHMNPDMIPNYRYGKDTFSRKKVLENGDYSMTALTENYLSYRKNKSELKVGRFLLETFLLKSHDTKMIPVAFEGAHMTIRSVPKTKIQLAYLTKQKLRDHENFHHVLAYNNDDSTPYSQWLENDDGAMHRGITVQKLKARGIQDRIIIAETKNQSIDNTTLFAGYTGLPNLVSSLTVGATYKFKLDNGVALKPSFVYMEQFDDGAGAIGGANLKTNTTGYKDPNDLSSSLLATRLDFIKGPFSIRLGYSAVEDGGDIIAPWHSQPTGGYTRAMSRMNWYANTKTTMLRADYHFKKSSSWGDVRCMVRYAKQDFDDNKPGTTSDLNVFTFDIAKRYSSIPNLMTKIRTAFVRSDHKVANKKDPSYNAIRLEMNYLF